MALSGTLTHRKTRKLARLMGIPVPCALGFMEALWEVTRDHAPDGGIGRLSDDDIAMEMFYDGDAAQLIQAMKEAELLDVLPGCRLYVHAWHEHSDDTTDLRLGRATKLYANGARPRLTKLSMKEREPIWARYGDSVARQGTAGHGVALPEPEPEPEPVPEPNTTLPSSGRRGKARVLAMADPPELRQAAAKVMRECNFSDARVESALVKAMRLEVSKTDEAPDWNGVAERMVSSQREYVDLAGKGLLRYVVSPRKFFAQGLWRDVGLWPPADREVLRLRGEANVGRRAG